MLPRPLTKVLERQDLVCRRVVSDQFRIDDKVVYIRISSYNIGDNLDHVWVRDRHVFEVPREDLAAVNLLTTLEVDLASEAVVLILTREFDVLEALEHDMHACGWFREHRLDGDADAHPAELR